MKNPTPVLAALAALVTPAFVLAPAGCAEKPSAGQIATFDLAAAIDNPRPFDLGEITDEIEFITLDDSRSEGLVANIWGVAQSRNLFHIYDNVRGPVKVFDRNGKFVATRGMIGRGPDEFQVIEQIAADPQNDNLYISGFSANTSDPSKRMMLGFDAGGTIFTRHDSITQGPVIFSQGRFVLLTYSPREANGSDDPWTLIETWSADIVLSGRLEVADTGTPRMVSPNGTTYTYRARIHDNGTEVLVSHALNDTVHTLRADQTGRRYRLEPAFVLDKGAYSPPPSMYGVASTEVWSGRYFLVERIDDCGRYVLVRADNGGTGVGRPRTLVFDRDAAGNSGDAPGFSATGPEDEAGLFLGGVRFTPMYVRGGRLVGWMSALDIVDRAAAITNPELRALAATLREDSNPVLVIATLKN